MGKKKEFQSICYQVHMSAQFFSSWISNADYLIPQSAPVDLLLSQLKHALDFFFLITPLASCLCISAGPGQRKFSHHLTVPVTGDLFIFLNLTQICHSEWVSGCFLVTCSTHKVPCPSSPHLEIPSSTTIPPLLQGQATGSVGKLVDWGASKTVLINSTNFIELLWGLINDCKYHLWNTTWSVLSAS